MSKRTDKTVSCKIEESLVNEFEDILAKNGHTKSEIFKSSIFQYIHYYSEDVYFMKMIKDLQFKKVK